LGDGFYAKKKVLDTTIDYGKHFIGKLRSDANLKYVLDKTQNPNPHGNRKYDGKVNWKALNLDKWQYVGTDQKYPHLRLYTQILYSPQFKRNLKVVFVWNSKTGRYVVLFSTDLMQDARQIVAYYQLRFKIEFIFRDAKQFTGLTHYNYEQIKSNSTLSMNSFIRKAYNTKFVQMLFDKLSFEPEFEAIFNINHTHVQQIINLGQVRY